MDSAPRRPVIAAAEPSDLVRVWGPAAILAVSFVWLFHRTLIDMAERWENDPAFSHGWVVAPAALAFAWYKRDTWLSTPVRGHWTGLAIIVFGLLTMLLGHWANVLFIPFLSLLIVVGGLIVYFGGWLWFRRLIFPYAFLFFMVPWPDLLVAKLSFPMQIGTSVYAAMMARLIGIPVVQDGLNLAIPPVKASFEVAVACSGMHSLVALMCLAAAFAYFTPAAMWKRWTLFAIGIPMALAANILRVFAILCVAYWISPDLAAKAFHDWSSPVLFLFSTMGLMSVRNVMMREPHAAPAVAAPGGGETDRPARPGRAGYMEDDDAF